MAMNPAILSLLNRIGDVTTRMHLVNAPLTAQAEVKLTRNELELIIDALHLHDILVRAAPLLTAAIRMTRDPK
jgi:hypothetical protein